MARRQKVTIAILAAVIAINVAVAVVVGMAEDVTNPLAYIGFAIPVVVFGWWIVSMLRGAGTRARSRAAGLTGRLKVLNATEALGGIATVNDNPYLRLDLELEIPGEPAQRFSKRSCS
jgi:hypothetical protein